MLSLTTISSFPCSLTSTTAWRFAPAPMSSTTDLRSITTILAHVGSLSLRSGSRGAVPSPETLNMLCCNMQIEAQGEEDAPAAAATKTTAKDNAAKVIDASSACL